MEALETRKDTLPNIVSMEMKAAAEMASAKSALSQVRELAEETIDALKRQRGDSRVLENTLTEVCSVFGCELGDLDKGDQEALREIVTSRPLTEISHGHKVSMSDKTAITLMAGLLKQVSGQSKEVFELHSASYYPEALVRSLVSRLLMLTELKFKSAVDGRVWELFVSEVGDICDDVTMQQKGLKR